MKFLKLLAVPFSALLLTSCAAPLLDAAFISDGRIVPGQIVYNFPSSSDRKVFDSEMHPAGSTLPKGVIFRNTLCVVSWMRPDNTRVFALWNADGKKVRVQLVSSGNIMGFYENNGKPTRLELFGNKIYADLSGKLLYIAGSPDLTVEIPPLGKK